MEANGSLWSATSSALRFERLGGDLRVEIAIVGGGITGLTAAALLAREGRRVALLEARRVGSGVTHRSTAHATEAVDARYHSIEPHFGKEGARLVAESSRAAIEQMARFAERFDCGFVRRPGYLFTERDRDLALLRDEHDAALRAGIPVRLLPEAPLPFATKCAVELPDQAQFHVGRYVAGLAAEASAGGALIFEGSRVLAVEDGEPCLVHVEGGPIVRATRVFVATHVPLNRVFLQTKIAAYRSYVLAFERTAIPDGLFWDVESPYHYFSSYVVDGVPWLLVGGEDHKTGTTTRTDERFDALLAWTRARLSVPEPAHRWSAQVEEPADGLPYIGRNSMSEHVFVATGFGGNGTTFGTVAAMIVRDLALGRSNPWAELYTATRLKPLVSATTYLHENVDYPIHLVSDRLTPPEVKSLADIAPGEGKILRVGGERLAVYRDPRGNTHAVSSVCTHLGCVVKFNAAERTWDCPCHGSRFSVDGIVLDGPATRPLASRATGEGRHESGIVLPPVAGAEQRAPAKGRG